MSKPDIDELVRWRDKCEALAASLQRKVMHCDEITEERNQMERERDEWRDKFLALNQTAGELCNACGWAFKIPGEPCRCEVVKERDEARSEVEQLKAQHLERHLESWEQYMQDNDVRRAYRRGAEAMREACAQWVDHWVSGHVADKLRDMPIPEEP